MIDCALRYGRSDCFSSVVRFEDGFRVWEAGDASIVFVGFVGAVVGLLFVALEELVEDAVGLTAVAALALGLGGGEVVEEAEAFGVVGDDFDEAADVRPCLRAFMLPLGAPALGRRPPLGIVPAAYRTRGVARMAM